MQNLNFITSRSESINAFFRMARKFPVLSAEEEVALAQRIHSGDKKAADMLALSNLRFAYSIAKQYLGRGLEIEDLVQEANYGLVEAAKTFDETRGFKFLSYAVFYMRKRIMEALGKYGSLVDVPMNWTRYIKKVNQVISNFELQNGRTPNEDELVALTDLRRSEIHAALTGSHRALSLDAPFGDSEDDRSLMDSLFGDFSADDLVNQESLSFSIRAAANELTVREREVLFMAFGIDQREHSFHEIAELFNVSTERIRQILKDAYRKIRVGNYSDTLLACAS